MTTTFKTTKELIESGDSPLPLEIISDKMGINLSAVEGISWTRMFDGQLVSVTIHLLPEMFNEDYEMVKKLNAEANPEVSPDSYISPPTEPKERNPYPALSAPSAHSLQECFKELKVGRPAGQQRYLDELIAELNDDLEPAPV